MTAESDFPKNPIDFASKRLARVSVQREAAFINAIFHGIEPEEVGPFDLDPKYDCSEADEEITGFVVWKYQKGLRFASRTFSELVHHLTICPPHFAAYLELVQPFEDLLDERQKAALFRKMIIFPPTPHQ